LKILTYRAGLSSHECSKNWKITS